MSRVYTKCEIKYKKKDQIYVLDLEWKEGIRESGQSGAKIHQVDGQYVEMQWGSFTPIAIHPSIASMITRLRARYNIEPIIS